MESGSDIAMDEWDDNRDVVQLGDRDTVRLDDRDAVRLDDQVDQQVRKSTCDGRPPV